MGDKRTAVDQGNGGDLQIVGTNGQPSAGKISPYLAKNTGSFVIKGKRSNSPFAISTHKITNFKILI